MKDKIKHDVKTGIRYLIFEGEQYVHFNDLIAYVYRHNDEKEPPIKYTISEIAEEYGMSAVKLNAYLKTKHIQYKCKGVWHINSKYAKRGYVVSVSGRNKKTHMYWTAKGKKFIESLLEEDGYNKIINR